MRTIFTNLLVRLATWLRQRGAAVPAAVAGPEPGWLNGGTIDAYRRLAPPTAWELLAELKGTSWTCAAINASVCAAFPPRLYVATSAGQLSPRCLTRAVQPATRDQLRGRPHLSAYTTAEQIEEVVDHPLLTLLRAVNPTHNAHDLWELTTLYQEVHGTAYWLIQQHPVLGIPERIWILPSQHVTPRRKRDSIQLVDHYEYRSGSTVFRYRPEEIIAFSYPDPNDPYRGGLSPLRAAFESAALASQFLAYKRSIWDNAALPGVVVSPADTLGEDERARTEQQWLAKFRRGGNGRVLVANTRLNVDLISSSLGDVAALAEAGATKEEISNAFGVPLAFLTSETNLANLQAAEHQHLAKTIRPRLQRRDEKLNERLIPLYDPTGRLFLASDDPVPANREYQLQQQQADLRYGVRSINEVRAERGLPPVRWGDTPWLPRGWLPTDRDRTLPTNARDNLDQENR